MNIFNKILQGVEKTPVKRYVTDYQRCPCGYVIKGARKAQHCKGMVLSSWL